MITMSEYASRRKTLMQKIGSNAIAILPAAPEVLRAGDALYPYRPSSDFYYLSGFEEPEAVLILAPGREEGEFVLFNRVRDRDREIWDGPRAGQEGAVKDYHANQAFPIDELKSKLPALLAGRETVYYTFSSNKSFDHLLLNSVNELKMKIRGGLKAPFTFVDISSVLHEMRLIKSENEINLMQKAVTITKDAHIRAIQACQPGKFEYELEAELMYAFLRQGARYAAYTPIVGAGRHTCILHYIQNNQKIHDGDLVLIDAGAEYFNYAADITRTFPANGRFSGEQRAVYDLVLASQEAAIACIKPGISWVTMQEVIVKILTQGLVDLGLLKGNPEDLIEEQAYLPFYMHRSGHWLGLDVHDVGQYRMNGAWRSLEPGMVFTVEPGLYISADIPGVPERWHNIGVRIEDNIAVTEKGYKVLSDQIPKSAEAIESLMAK